MVRPQFKSPLIGIRPSVFELQWTCSKPFSSSRIILQTSNFKPTRPTTENRRKSISETLEPHWKAFTSQLQEYRAGLNRVKTQFSHHLKKAQDSIREANQKLAEQERDRLDQRLNYDKDVETSGKIKDLPSQRETHRRQWSRKLEFYLDSLQETVLTATKALNDVTGYSSIQKLRKSIDLMEKNLEESRAALKLLKERYAIAIEQRTQSQKELNELLQRKSSWSPAELERFTSLYKDDAMNLKKEQDLKEEVRVKEFDQEELNNELYHAILTRYHEEQIWSDKIRRTSTWGTFILMGVNIVLFLVFQLLLEPWKRKRLTRSFEDKVKKALDQYSIEQSQKFEAFSSDLKSSQTGNPDIIKPQQQTAVATPLDDTIRQPEPTVERVHDLSIRRISISAIWNWFKDFGRKFQSSKILQLTSETTLSNLELYCYSALLLILGALSGSLI